VSDPPASRPSLGEVAREWLRLGARAFGGPPAHIALMRRRFVDERRWLSPQEFEDAIAATSLLPGPASTQLSIFCGWRVRRSLGALVGGACFIAPGLVVITALAAVLLHHPPIWVLGAADGAGAAVPAVALFAASALVPASRARMGARVWPRRRWLAYASLGAATGAAYGSLVVLVLLACGAVEVAVRRPPARAGHALVPALVPAAGLAGLGALAWVAFKVGALSYGGGFVIVPLMQHDVVDTYHWMSGTVFLYAVALGQLTPGPVVLTIAVVGYAAGGLVGALVGVVVAFSPSFAFVLAGASRFDALRANQTAGAFLGGAGPSVIGAIAGSALPLGLLIQQWWQVGVLAAALAWLLAARRGIVSGLLLAGAVGALAALAGAAV
jgi:chromate transporter